MGLSEEEFWNLEIEEFHALLKRYRAQERQADIRALLTSCALINLLIKPDPPVVPEDFLDVKKTQTIKEQEGILKLINAALGGEVIERGAENG